MKQNLKNLFDFSHVESLAGVHEHALKVAEELLNNWGISSFDKSLHKLLAVEFYLIIPKVFEDDKDLGGATHKRVEQLTRGRFYVHTKNRNHDWTHPAFNRHGIDITCGNKSRGIYGGILLRHLDGPGHRDGSGLALRVLMRGDSGFQTVPRKSKNSRWSDKEKINLKELNDSPIFGGSVCLKPCPLNGKWEIVPELRIGIGGTKFANEKLRFVLKPPS